MDSFLCTDQSHGDNWSIYCGDCIELIKNIDSNTIHYSLFSPPFADLYVYSDSERDMGNCRNYDEFFIQFGFLIRGLHRVLMPGRLVSIHCMNIPAMKERDGYIGLKDFRGDIIRAFQKEGFIFHAEAVIWKDPLVEATRTKALGLMHKQLCKDSSMCRQGIPDYIVTMRKPGENKVRIEHPRGLESFAGEGEIEGVYSHNVWRKYASPVWMDIRQTFTLNRTSARVEEDEKHICLAKGSLVLTRDGYKEIQNINIGDMVLSHTGRWNPVVAKKCTGVNPVIQTKAQGVGHLITTPSHKVWARKTDKVRRKDYMIKTEPCWTEAKDLKNGYVNLKLPSVEKSEIPEDQWWLLGRYLADGHYHSARSQFFISVGNKKIDEFKERCSQYIGAENVKDGCVQFGLKKLPKELKLMLHKCGYGSYDKQVPIGGLCLCVEKSEALLSGYLSGDGCKNGTATASCSISRSLSLGMAMVAQRARNVIASVYAGKQAGEHTIHGRIVNQRQLWIMSWRDGAHRFGAILEDGAWKPVSDIVGRGEMETWSIQVERDESYTAEGCIVKNCPLQLDTIERCLTLWSAKDDIVLSPFAGIGSEGYVAVRMGRKFIGFELKSSYYNEAVKNLKRVEDAPEQLKMF